MNDSCPCCRQRGLRERLEAKAEQGNLDGELLCGLCEAAGFSMPDMSVHTIPTTTSVVVLDAAEAFSGLTVQERSYAHGLSLADWGGASICLLQTSPESVPIFALFQLVFCAQSVADFIEAAKTKEGLTQNEIDQAMMYAAAFYGNLGNYKSFGDTKFVPELPKEQMRRFLLSGGADPSTVEKLWAECNERMYSLTPRQRQLGLGQAKGISTYFSANCGEEDAEIAGRFLVSVRLSPYNTRLFKDAKTGEYTVLIASATEGVGEDPVGKLCTCHAFEGYKFTVQRGDYAPLMARIVEGLRQALPHCANATQTAMLEKYIESFQLGSINDHMDASRHWIKDTGPAVESYIGFIESYRDPSGVRGEWEGFVACVNREVSKKFQLLVDQAETLLKKMPWPSDFEKDKFMRPDFTSLDVIAFGSSGVPAGINIPNYDEIRQSEGFKNVSLGNVLAASYGAMGAKPVTFLGEADQESYKALQGPAFEVQVGIHELLGHGSGKLFIKEELAGFEQVINPLTNEAIAGPFYSNGATWDTTFSKIASTYEECRAECAGLYLCIEPEVLVNFGHTAPEGENIISDVTYINWLHMARAGLMALEFFTPETCAWRQAHMNARYVILRVLLEAGQGLVDVRQKQGDDGKPDIELSMKRDLIKTVGKKAIGDFLLKLQVHKSLGDFAAGSCMYGSYSQVPEDMLALRKVVMARKEPRKLLVQPHVHATGEGQHELKAFAASSVGMIESFVARYPAQDTELMALYEKEKDVHTAAL